MDLQQAAGDEKGLHRKRELDCNVVVENDVLDALSGTC